MKHALNLHRCALRLRLALLALASLILTMPGRGEFKLPPKPAYHFTDNAHIVSDDDAQEMDRKLAQLERDTSIQFVVWLDHHVPEGTSLDQFCTAAIRGWSVGQKGKNNGVLLAAFIDDHKVRIEPGYGMEGALPDTICALIIQSQIAPNFKKQNYAGGLRAAIESVVLASHGEYKGTGRTLHEQSGDSTNVQTWIIIGFTLFIILLSILGSSRRRGRGGWYYGPGGGTLYGGGGAWGGGGSGSGGSWGGGGFSGGGGSSGGGGASGSW